MTSDRGGEGREPSWIDYRGAPTTFGLATAWVVVYLLMCWDQGSLTGGGNPLSGGISVGAAYDFGSNSPAEIRSGEVWRALTATCVHFGLLHIGMNLVAFAQIGRMVESWYGSSLLLAFYVFVGGVGNLLAAWAKLGLVGREDDPSAGGSGVICGLIALVAVVGWRSRTRFGLFLSKWMLTALASTALLGVMVPQVDNFAHASGAILGALVGLIHRPLVRLARTPTARLIGALSLAILVGCAALQFRQTRGEYAGARSGFQRKYQVLAELEALKKTVHEESTARGGRFSGPDRGTRAQLLGALIQTLEAGPELPAWAASDASYRRMIDFAKAARSTRPSPGALHAFDLDVAKAQGRLRGDIAEDLRRLSSFPIPGRGLVRVQVGAGPPRAG